MGKLVAPTAFRGLLVDDVQDPLERHPSALSDGEGDGEFQGTATSTSAGNVPYFEEWRNRVDGDCDVEDGVKREVGGGRSPW